MGAGLSSKARVTIIDDATTYTEPSGSGDGVDLKASRDGAYLPDRAAILLRQGATAGGATTLVGPVWVDLYIDGNWYKVGPLNNGDDIAVGNTGYAERIEDVGMATRIDIHAASNPADKVTAVLAFVDDDDE